MGRMTKYLRQTAQHQSVVLDPDGTTKLDVYGKPIYSEAVTIKCRKEPAKTQYNSSLGAFVNHTSTYYIDADVVVRVQDLMDGQLVQQVYEYRDGSGTLVGYEVYV